MCRWLAYSGSPVLLEELLVKPDHSLIDQSKHSRLGATTTNGDGFGVGWYGAPDTPGVFHGTEPAWNDRNLRDIAAHISSPLIFAHIRASTGTAVQETNCHPFRHDNWLWMHNGAIRDFPRVKRDLALAVDPSLYPLIEGSTDSELFFFLALTLGLEDNPPLAVERAVGLIEETGRRHDVEHPIQMTVATTDGDSIWAFRYSSEHDSRSLFFSTDVETLRHQYPDNPVLHGLSAETRIVLSEPLGDLAGAWNAVPESSWGVVQPGQDELHPFTPHRSPEQLRDRPRLEGAAGGGVRRCAIGGFGDGADPPLSEMRVEALEDAVDPGTRRGPPRRRTARSATATPSPGDRRRRAPPASRGGEAGRPDRRARATAGPAASATRSGTRRPRAARARARPRAARRGATPRAADSAAPTRRHPTGRRPRRAGQARRRGRSGARMSSPQLPQATSKRRCARALRRR